MSELIPRILYTVQKLRLHRQDIAKIYHYTPTQQSTLDIDPDTLKKAGVKVVVLDFDGVLAAHGEPYPNKDIEVWLQKYVKTFGVSNLFILSNKPLPIRAAYFAQHFSGVQFIQGVRKKPYPDGLEKVIKITQQAAKTHILIDDRLLTGCLSAVIAGAQACYITAPFSNYKKRPISERFFAGLRWLEKNYVRLFLHYK